jgi:hypothetical protein
MTNQKKDIIRSIQSKFVYQYGFPNYYEPVEDWEVEANDNINVIEETKENYLRPSKYVEA